MSHTNYVEAPHPHVLPKILYYAVFLALMGLTVATVAVLMVDLGPFNIVIAMGIAVIKASLVGAIFMHLWFDNKTNSLVMLLSMVFFSVFVIFSLLDLESRGLVDPIETNYYRRDAYVDAQKEKGLAGKEVRASKDKWWSVVDKKELNVIQPEH